VAVAVDVAGTEQEFGATSSPVNYTGLTIGSISASNPGLLAVVLINQNSLVTWSGLTRTLSWDSAGTPQAMSLIGEAQVTDSGTDTLVIELWGLVNPHTGLKTLAYTYTGGSHPNILINAISLTGVLQTSNALAFPTAHFNSASNTNSVGPASVAITSAAGDMAFAAYTAIFNDTLPMTSPAGVVQWTGATGAYGAFGEAFRAAGASTVTFTGTAFGSQAWITAGCDVVAAAAALMGAMVM
jgi:hypothetical protein